LSATKMRMIVILYGIFALLSIGLHGKDLPVTVYLDANSDEDMRSCPKQHIVPRAPVPFKNVDNVKNWVSTFFACLMYFVNDEDIKIKFEEMYKNHDKAVYMEDDEEMTFNEIATKADENRDMVDYLSITITILKFKAYSITLMVKEELIFEENFGAGGPGKRFMTVQGIHDYNAKGQLIYAELNSQNRFINKFLNNPSTKTGNVAFQIGFGDQINNPYGIYVLFVIILLLLNLCVLYKQCSSTQKKIKYKKVRNYDVESTESES